MKIYLVTFSSGFAPVKVFKSEEDVRTWVNPSEASETVVYVIEAEKLITTLENVPTT